MKRNCLSLVLLLTATTCLAAKPVASSACYDRSADSHGFITFMTESGWCWYQDPRAILHDGKVFIGGVNGNGSGAARVGVYDLEQKKLLGAALLQDGFDRDDHNSPVFFPRPDGSVLAVYAKHGREKVHYYRISDPENPLKWGAEYKHKLVSSNPKDGVTYMNLYEMKNEGKLYNFYRGINYNPTFETSSDAGKTWGDAVHFFRNEVGGRQRPYARYTGNGTDTVYMSVTDAHPRNFGNSIYYFEFRKGNFYKADGTLIRALNQGGALAPCEAECIYQGSGAPERRGDQSALGSSWTSSIAIDASGHPHVAYTLYVSNTDHRYRIASWDGSRWHDREVAFGGKCLYDRESSYTGLITLDPVDPSVVFISTDVDPSTGQDFGAKHEIYRAKIGLSDEISSIQWTAVTKDSPARNIRPVILRDGATRVVLWSRGDFVTYKDFDLDTVGLIETER